MRKTVLLALSFSALAFIYACGGEKSAPKEGAAQPGQGAPAGQQQVIPPVGKPVVEVPDIIKGKWKGVVLVVDDKEKKTRSDEKVGLGDKFKVPGSDLTVVVKEFFPAFVMQGSNITSTSNESTNPAAQVVVSEGGSEIFSGWLFARYPTTHAFTHPRFAITLKEGIPK
ncbi:MAG: DUF2155 domain-containing protein [Nitrospirota bacterium]